MNEKFKANIENSKHVSEEYVFDLQTKAVDGLRDVSRQIDSVLAKLVSEESDSARPELEKLLISLEFIRKQIEGVIAANEEIMIESRTASLAGGDHPTV